MSDGYTVKEIVNELRNEQRGSIVVQAKILTSLENIDSHLANLSSKVATHEKKIGVIETKQTRNDAYAVAIGTVFGVVITGVNLFFK